MTYDRVLTENDRRVFRELIDKTRMCLASPERTTQQGIECETAYLSHTDAFTYHTHPNGIDYPSDVDKRTTKKFGKRFLMIGLVPTNEVVVYSDRDGYSQMVGRFKV